MTAVPEGVRDDAGRSPRRPWLALASLFAALVLLLVAFAAVSHYSIGRVESMRGNAATVLINGSDQRFDVEVLDPDLKVGAEVVVNVQGSDAALVATSPGTVRVIVTLKRLIP